MPYKNKADRAANDKRRKSTKKEAQAAADKGLEDSEEQERQRKEANKLAQRKSRAKKAEEEYNEPPTMGDDTLFALEVTAKPLDLRGAWCQHEDNMKLLSSYATKSGVLHDEMLQDQKDLHRDILKQREDGLQVMKDEMERGGAILHAAA